MLCLATIFHFCILYSETMKGGIFLPSTGYIQVNAYTANARIPLKDVAITVTASEITFLRSETEDAEETP